MIIKALRTVGISLAAGALLSLQLVTPTVRHAATGAASYADLDPSTFHHWPTGAATAYAGIDPSTFHHWPSLTLVADLDPFTFHHWG